jgi:hypothetical protein
VERSVTVLVSGIHIGVSREPCNRKPSRKLPGVRCKHAGNSAVLSLGSYVSTSLPTFEKMTQRHGTLPFRCWMRDPVLGGVRGPSVPRFRALNLRHAVRVSISRRRHVEIKFEMPRSRCGYYVLHSLTHGFRSTIALCARSAHRT